MIKKSTNKKRLEQPELPAVTIRNARIGFRNFSGKETQFNAAGRRNFCVFLTGADAQSLDENGWKVKYLKPREAGDPEQPYIQVTVGYKGKPPKILMISGTAETYLDEDTVKILDWADIDKVDLVFRPYAWEVNGSTGIKAYLKSMRVTLVPDELELMYHPAGESKKLAKEDGH
jgi:hypothetical protein